ncbi:hypothetical protein [Limimaricola soesokkakensis]|uniref:hypothetical protein n=1 Tax=Limimaricola soesokkakensis TaxID=1343159 RepID=UPI003517FD1A
MGKLFDVQSPFFIPLWRRLLVVGLALGWALVELAHGAPGWALLFGAAGMWCAYQFFVVFDPPRKDAGEG